MEKKERKTGRRKERKIVDRRIFNVAAPTAEVV
jgi:hypothetical protein